MVAQKFIHEFFFIEGTFEPFHKMLESFQLALYHYNADENNPPLYNPQLMKPFANKHAPGLFDTMMNSIVRSDDRYMIMQYNVAV